MIGVDLGLNLGSVTEIKKGQVVFSLVLKFAHEKELGWDKRVAACAKRVTSVITSATDGNPTFVAIEEPIYSWGRRNPKAFAKSVALFTLVNTVLLQKGYRTIRVNNKTAKKVSGSGKNKKLAMISAFKKETGKEPGHSTQKGRETLADSYFIARAGVEQLREGRKL